MTPGRLLAETLKQSGTDQATHDMPFFHSRYWLREIVV
jgi:hypothetical protein